MDDLDITTIKVQKNDSKTVVEISNHVDKEIITVSLVSFFECLFVFPCVKYGDCLFYLVHFYSFV